MLVPLSGTNLKILRHRSVQPELMVRWPAVLAMLFEETSSRGKDRSSKPLIPTPPPDPP